MSGNDYYLSWIVPGGANSWLLYGLTQTLLCVAAVRTVQYIMRPRHANN